MAPSRRTAPLDIYQDSSTTYDTYRLNCYTQPRSALQPLTNGSISTNVILDPPMAAFSYSPEKQSPHSSPQPQPLHTDLFHSVHFQPPEHISFAESPTKRSITYATDTSHFLQKPKKALFTTFPSNSAEKENMYVHQSQREMAMPKSDPIYGYSNLLKRGLDESESALHKRSHKKQKKELEDSSDPVEIPDPKDLPVPKDDGLKPNHSYAQLIGMAILRAPNRRLTLAQIYKWISGTFKFYGSKDTGWMNSIRHNLSLNKAFIKQERPKDDPGKGNYWALKPGTEAQFIKDKPGRRSTNPEGGSLFNHIASDGIRPSTAPALGVFVLPPKPLRPVDSSKFPSEQELSSDATLPASDADYHDDEHDAIHMPPPSSRITHSSPLQNIHSSPPIPNLARSRVNSPTIAHFSTVAGSRKKRSSSFRDSGFFSSIESSAPRVGHHSFDAQIDRPVIKRGRAEEEIARIRSSSFDSPTKYKPRVSTASAILPTSSPLQSDNTFQIPPLTPGVRFEPPSRKPPASASPNTHLRNHRDAIRDFVGTPAHGLLPNGLPTLNDNFSFSPMFSVHDESHKSPGFNDAAADTSPRQDDVFNAYDIGLWYRGSPIKQSARQQRPMLHRATTTAGVLADITGLSQNSSRLASPFHLSASLKPMNKMSTLTGSPNKRMSPNLPYTEDDENIFEGVDLGSDGSVEADGGLDIFKGFSKIGADASAAAGGKENERHQPPAAAKPSRPVPGRSVTSLF